jgi:hypothetical protein
MMTAMRRRQAFLVLLVTFFAVPSLRVAAQQPAAQEVIVRGHVLGPDEAPLPGHRVVLHRVDAAGGATIAETMSDDGGRFELSAESSADTAAVYFVASRYDGELYIGDMFRPTPGTTEQTIQVGVAATSATAMMEGQMPIRQPPASGASRNWLLLGIPLLGIAGVLVYMLIPRDRIPPQRAALIRVAELDERLENALPAQRESLLEQRRQLIEQLRGG